MRLKIEQILKPGAKFKVEKIDFESPEVKEIMERCFKAQEECRKRQQWTQKDYDAMRKVITI